MKSNLQYFEANNFYLFINDLEKRVGNLRFALKMDVTSCLVQGFTKSLWCALKKQYRKAFKCLKYSPPVPHLEEIKFPSRTSILRLKELYQWR